MQKKLLLSGLLCTATFCSFAQDTLFASDLNMVIGETYALKTCNPAGVSPGAAGSGMIWNFSSLVPLSDDTGKALAPTSTPYFASFPTANVAFTGPGVLAGAITYMTTNSSVWQQNGYYSAADTNLIMSDPMDQLRYPMYLTKTYSDPFAGTLTLGPITAHHDGTLNVTCDGRGTLILPGRSEPNVFRVNSTQNFTDSTNLFGTTIIKSYVISSYDWYQKGTHTALLTIQTVTEVGNTTPDFEFVAYMGAKVSSASSTKRNTIAAKVYPNPANGYATVQFQAPLTPTQTRVVLCDVAGRELSTVADKLMAGKQDLRFSTDGVQPGYYLVRINCGTEQSSVPVFVR